MNNRVKITKVSAVFYGFLSFLLAALPVGVMLYWIFINELPETLLTVNMQSMPLVSPPLPVSLRLMGFLASLFPLCALLSVLYSLRKLFAQYRGGNFFSLAHVVLFKKIAWALFLWVLLSIGFDGVQSVLFSWSNPPGSRVLHIGMSSGDVAMLGISGLVLFIAWIMDEGRRLSEENELTV